MRKLFILSIFQILCCAATFAQISSPDGKLRVSVKCQDGKPGYTVMYGNDIVLGQSSIGLKTSIGDFRSGLTLAETSEVKSVTDNYSLPNAKKSNISYTANECTFAFANADGSKAFDVEFHVDNNNVAFRYIMHAQKDRLACLVEEEATSYILPEGTKTFLCPQMTPQTGFARTAPSYETFYEYDAEMGKNGQGRGYVFPALFKVKTSSSGAGELWVLLSETNVGGNYCASRIESDGKNGYVLKYPEDTEFGGVGTASPGIMLPNSPLQPAAALPWRTITVGTTLAPLAETTIQWDLVKPQYKASQEYKYGRSAWSWIIRMDTSCNYDEQKEYVDFAAAMGWEYLLIDAWWDANIGYERIEELARYAKTKGVEFFLWYNSNGYWNDAMQGPRGKMHRMITRREEIAWMKKAGIKGIKVDFVGSDKQQSMQMYEDILADANDYGIMVIFHGCTIPRGWERMYPNFVSCEAVRASENLSFGQYDNDVEALAATIHPVCRNAIGNMDFGGSALNKFYSTDNKNGKIRCTSDVYALATAILFQTPVQNFALAPNNLTDAPAWAVDFMKSVPVTWDDMKFIDGYPGKYVILARRTGDKWYVVAVNAADQPLVRDVTLPTDAQTVTVYSDDKNLQGSVKQVKVKKNKVRINVPKNGAVVILSRCAKLFI